MDDLISRQAAIDAVAELASSMSVCISVDECHGMKRMQGMAVRALDDLPSVQPQSTMGQVNEAVQSTNDCISRQAAIDALGEKPLVWDDLSDFDLGKAAQWSDDVDAIKALPSAQPEIIRCKDCKYIEEHHYEENGEPPYIKYTCTYKAGLAKGYQVHEWDFCSRAERRQND